MDLDAKMAQKLVRCANRNQKKPHKIKVLKEEIDKNEIRYRYYETGFINVHISC